MFILIIVSLLTVTQVVNCGECTSACTLVYSMDQPFAIPDDEQCRRESKFTCQARVTFDYINRKYTVDFPDSSSLTLDGFDNITLSSERRFEYTTVYMCNGSDADCEVRFLARKIPEMIGRNYSISSIINELSAMLVENSSIVSPNNSLSCYYDTYNTLGNTGVCSLNNSQTRGRCQIEYNQRSRVIRSHKCNRFDNNTMAINIYDSDSGYKSLTVMCNRNLCNSKPTIEAVIQILAKYNVTDVSGGTGRAQRGRAEKSAPGFLLLLALILIRIWLYFK